MSAELIKTQFGNVLVAELEDGSVKSISVQTAANDLRYVIETPDIPDDFDWTSLEVIKEYLMSLANGEISDVALEGSS